MSALATAAFAADRAYTAIRHHIQPDVWFHNRKHEATFLSQGHRGRYGRLTGREMSEDAACYDVLERLAGHFRAVAAEEGAAA